MIKPNAWNGWDPLKVCMIGSSVPDSYFSSIKDKKLADSLTKVIEETNEDLANLQSQLEKRGIEVIEHEKPWFMQSTFHETQEYLEDHEHADWRDEIETSGIYRPNLTPRDYIITMGDKVLVTTPNKAKTKFVESICENVVSVRDHDDMFDRSAKAAFMDWEKEWHGGFGAPFLTRVGKDVIVDTTDAAGVKQFAEQHFDKFNYIEIEEGGHSDGIFCPVRPGHIISIVDDTLNIYDKTFPNWDIFYIHEPEPLPLKKWYVNKNKEKHVDWWIDGMNSNPALQEFVDEWLQDWVGFCEESIFEVNMLSLNENQIMGSTWNDKVVKHLESIGTEFIHVPFRHRRFWDGGLHCLTVDLVREGQQRQYNL